MESSQVEKDKALPAMTAQQRRFSTGSSFGLYRSLACGDASFAFFVFYEFCVTCIAGLGGALGFGLRALLYRKLFKRCGARPAFGRGVLIRRPKQIRLGQRALVDDYAVLDVRDQGGEITLDDHVSIGRFSTLAAKGGSIHLGSGVNVGSYCRLATQSRLIIGESTLIGAYCYLGPGNHKPGAGEKALIEQEMEIKGGVSIGKNVWLGANVTVLDGVTIGDGAIVGAHSLVLEDIPARSVAVGSPAKIVRQAEQ